MPDKKPTLLFPKKFMWGASVSSHQVEGGNHNTWSVWELENAKSLASQAHYQYGDLESWNHIKREATDPANYISGKATDHYNLYEKDFDLLKQMNMNTFRFSIEWSRVEPKEGVWNAEAIEYYKRYVMALKKRQIEPVVTLFHFTLPVWFAEKGGFTKKSNVSFFTRYAEKIISELGTHVRFIITINEPDIYANESYRVGHWTPNESSLLQYIKVLNNLARAHNQAAQKIHALNRRYKVSVAKHTIYFYAGDDALLSKRTSDVMQYVQDDYFIKKVIKHCDFLGANYYVSNRVYGYRIHNPEERISDMGWDMSPANIQQALERLHDKYHLPIMVTENGLADAKDENRQWWIMHTLMAMQRSMDHGVELIGYIHWSLTDNIELEKGRWPRFGLASVDYSTMERTLRPSAIWYGRVLKKLREDGR